MGQRFSDRSNAVSKYLQEMGQFSILSVEDEQALAASLAGKDKAAAITKLVESNLPFVWKVASDFRNSGLPFEDLLNEGNLGLLEAARHFDPGRGTRFITYAVWWIRKSILLALSRDIDLIRVPRYQIKKTRMLRAAETALASELGRKPEREEISRELRSPTVKIDKLLQVRQKPLSLDDKIGQ